MENKKTCLYDKHVALGAQISPFGGFDMPIQYSSIIDEHQAVRQHCGVFDVSHMGEVRITGNDAERYINHIFTNDVKNAPIGKIYYGMMCYPDGGTVDDLLVYKMSEQDFFVVINAANIDKDVAWMTEHKEGYDINLENCSDYYGQLAVQGPDSPTIMHDILGIACNDLVFYTTKTVSTNEGENIIVSRTGYTGEDGFEIYGSHNYIRQAWDKLIDSGKCKPCGLGCRDTLRFEVGLPLYGDELSNAISPIMAGLSIFCKLDKDEFIGKEALIEQKNNGVERRLRGIELNGHAIPRHGYKVLKDDVEVGEVTTGYRLISVDKSCAVALVDNSIQLGDTIEIQIRKKTFSGTVVKKKFYEKHYYKKKPTRIKIIKNNKY